MLRNSQSAVRLGQDSLETPEVVEPKEMEMTKVLYQLGEHIKEGQDVNRRLMTKIEKMDLER